MLFWEIVKAAILGIVQGITEFLPISSTGHLILIEEFLTLNFSDGFREMFFVVIQFGSILAVLVLYWTKLWPLKRDRESKLRIGVKKDTVNLWLKVVIAVLPGALVGFLIDDYMDAVFYNFPTIATTLLVYGVGFILIEWYNAQQRRRGMIRTLEQFTWKHALIIGAFQVLALIPGTSRSGSTIMGAILIGVARPVAAEFSFFLAVPMMLGASLLKLVKYGFNFTGAEIAVLLTGMIVAFGVSVLAIRFLMGYLKKRDFTAFGWYRIVLSVVIFGYLIISALV